MKPYNIAVCLSAEPRTWQHTAEAIRYYFSSDVHNYKFFGHTWNHSFFSKEKPNLNPANQISDFWNEHYDINTLHNMINELYGMSKLLVEDKKVVTDVCNYTSLVMPTLVPKTAQEAGANLLKPVGWAHMSYSKMRSNSLKTQYELENNMQFDIVVSARFDVCYPPGAKFDQALEQQGTILPTALYTSTHYFPNEYFLPNANDVIYFGNSRIMNVVDGFYRCFASGKFWEMLDENYNDCALKLCGYNVNLYKWLVIKNILIKSYDPHYAVFRKRARHLKWPEAWDNILEVERSLFR